MIVTAHIKFGLYSNFLDSMLQAEDERLEGESVEDGAIRVYKRLEVAVERLKKEAESFRGQIISEAKSEARQPTPVPEHWEIQKDNPQDTLAQIQTAPNLETLKSFKVIASSDPTRELYNAYCLRMKELNEVKK